MLSVAIKDHDAREHRVTEQGGGTAAEDELWTAGEAAAYLNAGGVNLGFTPRRVTDMIKRGELAALQTHTGGWRRTPASGIRELRRAQLLMLGRTDPADAAEAAGRHRMESGDDVDQGVDQGA